MECVGVRRTSQRNTCDVVHKNVVVADHLDTCVLPDHGLQPSIIDLGVAISCSMVPGAFHLMGHQPPYGFSKVEVESGADPVSKIARTENVVVLRKPCYRR